MMTVIPNSTVNTTLEFTQTITNGSINTCSSAGGGGGGVVVSSSMVAGLVMGGNKNLHITSHSNCSSVNSSPSKVLSSAYHHQLQHQLQHNGGGGHGHHTLNAATLQHMHHSPQQHPAIVNLKQCSSGGGGGGSLSGGGGGGSSVGGGPSCCGSGCVSGSSTPPLHHHTLYPGVLMGTGCYSASGPNSLVNSPAMGRRKRFTSSSSNCSTQFNNNYTGLDVESLDDMLRKVCRKKSSKREIVYVVFKKINVIFHS